MNQPILTVAIAAYNVEKYIDSTLKPFANTKFNNGILEVLIINDGSKDSTEEIVNKYVSSFPMIFRLISKENGGWGSTVNTGIQYATGKYFKQLDGDDYFCSDNLDLYLKYLLKHDSDLVVTPFRSFSDTNGQTIDTIKYKEMEGIVEEQLSEYIQYYPLLQMHAACFRTSLLKDKVRITEKCFYTDVEFMTKAISNCSSISYYNNDIYCYRLEREGQSMSLDGFIKHYKEHEKISLILVEYCQNFNGGEKIKNAIINRTITMIDAHYQILLSFPMNDSNKNKFIEYDKKLKKFPTFYKSIKSKKVILMRCSHYLLYIILGGRKRK